MCECFFFQIQSNKINRLSLALVNCHCKTQLNWKLFSVQCEWEVSFCTCHSYSRDHHSFSFFWSKHVLTFQNISVHNFHSQSCSITQSNGLVQISLQHHWAINFQFQCMWW